MNMNTSVFLEIVLSFSFLFLFLLIAIDLDDTVVELFIFPISLPFVTSSVFPVTSILIGLNKLKSN